jgi:uncharacterized protein (DUF2461 family)
VDTLSISSVLKAKDYKGYFKKAIFYEKYKLNFEKELQVGDIGPFSKYLPQNFSRQSRLDRKFVVKHPLVDAIKNLDQKIYWLVISEHWCGDASQIIPVLNKVAEQSAGKIDLKLLYRDQNADLMDAHLTDGKSRSIPMVIQLNDSFEFMRSYGPRPNQAQTMVKDLISKGQSYDIALHTWYAKDKQKSIQEDIGNLLG